MGERVSSALKLKVKRKFKIEGKTCWFLDWVLKL